MKDRPHDDVMAAQFLADPAYAEQLLNEVVREGNLAELAILVRQLPKGTVQNLHDGDGKDDK